MGRSNPHIFKWYGEQLASHWESIAFLGWPGPDAFTESLTARQKDYYDLSRGNWQIEAPSWDIAPDQYELVMCTRCPYFARDPLQLVRRLVEIARPGGTVFLDWGLGDHWRIQPYRVGWVRDGQQESVTFGSHRSVLYSCFWDDALESHEQAQSFRDAVRKHGYDDARSLGDIVRDEVPELLSTAELAQLPIESPIRSDLLYLWPDSPQLNISTVLTRSQ